jgi:hypothetical protein
MEQLIEKLTTQYGVTQEQATGIINTVIDYQTETNTAIATPVAAAETNVAAPAAEKEESMFEKAEHFVTDHLPGGLKEKAEEMMGGLGDKVKGMFK